MSKSIKVFKTTTPETYGTTDTEKRDLYDKWKSDSELPGFIWDAFLALEIKPDDPKPIPKSNIITVQVKALLQYAIPLFDVNPHTASRIDKPDAIWLQYDSDLRALDLSFKEYRIPADEKFRVSGLQLWWRKAGGATVPRVTSHRNALEILPEDEILDSDSWSLVYPDGTLSGTHLTPLPFSNQSKLMFTKDTSCADLDPLIDEINSSNQWYLKNYSLLFQQDYHRILITAVAAPMPKWKNVTDPIAKKIQPYQFIRFSDEWKVLLSDINQADLLDLWQKTRLLGVTSPIVDKHIRELETAWKAVVQARAHRFESQTLMRNEAVKNALAHQVAKKDFVELDTKERTQVMKLYERSTLIKPRDESDARKLARTIHMAFDSAVDGLHGIKSAVEEFKRQCGTSTLEHRDFVPMKSGKGEICPHYIDLLKQTLKAKKNALGQYDTSSILERIVQNWAERAPVNFKYYCSRCGELLMTEDLEDFNVFGNQTIITSTSDKDPLWFYILAEVSQVVRRVRFTHPPDAKVLVRTVSKTIEPEINNIQTELQKSKTKSLEDIRQLIIIYISAFTFALLSKMIIENPKAAQWNIQIQTPLAAQGAGTNVAAGRAITKQADAIKVLSIAYNLLIDSNQNRINKIKDFSIEHIKPILLRGYEWARNAKYFRPDEDKMETGLEWTTQLVNDPWYNAVYDMASIHNKDLKFTDFKTVLGATDPLGALGSNVPFEKAFRPEKNNDSRTLSYLLALEYVDSGIFREFAVPRSPLLINWDKKWEPIQQLEDKAELERIEYRLWPKKQLYNNAKGQVPYFKPLDISLVKCPDGRKHDFSLKRATLIMDFGSKGLKKMRLDDLLKTPQTAKLVDYACANCGMHKNAKPKKIQDELERTLDRQNFYVYYENRCPLGDLHDFPHDKSGFVGSLPCKRCKFSRDWLISQPTEYYNQYKSKRTTREEKIQVINMSRDGWKFDGKREKWSVTLTSIYQIAKESGIHSNLWINLGLTEHRNFALLKLGKINPQSTIEESESAARLVKLKNYVHWVNRQYLMVKNHHRIALPMGLKTLLEEDQQVINLHQSLSQNMPIILKDFDTRLEQFRGQSAKVLCNFALHTLCNMLLQIRSLDKIKRLARSLFDYLVKQIMLSDKMMSELEIQKTHIAQADQVGEDDPEIDDDAYLELGEQRDIMDKGTEDPFSLDEVDIEDDNVGRDDTEFMD